MMLVSIVLPCYNPPPGWEQIIYERYYEFCKLSGEQAQLLVVMDGKGSRDYTDALTFLENTIGNLMVIAYDENRGKGYAIRQGVAAASGDLIIYTDVDFPYTADSLIAVYNGLRNEEYDVCIGVKNDSYYSHVPFLRKAISHFLRFMIRLFLSMPVTDTQCGLKGFRKNVAPIFLQTTINRYLFDLEFVRNCYKGRNLRVKPIPVALNENVHFRKMDYRILLPELLNFMKLLFK